MVQMALSNHQEIVNHLRFDDMTYLHFHDVFTFDIVCPKLKWENALAFKPRIYNLGQFCDAYQKVFKTSSDILSDGMEYACALQYDQNHCFLYFERSTL